MSDDITGNEPALPVPDPAKAASPYLGGDKRVVIRCHMCDRVVPITQSYPYVVNGIEHKICHRCDTLPSSYAVVDFDDWDEEDGDGPDWWYESDPYDVWESEFTDGEGDPADDQESGADPW